MSVGTMLEMTACNPADHLGLSGVGRIEEGNAANLVLLNSDTLAVERVMHKGGWV